MKASILISKALKLVYNPDGITIYQSGGIFNDLTHYHMHVAPRYIGQNFSDFFTENETEVPNIETNFEKVMLQIKDALKIVKNLANN